MRILFLKINKANQFYKKLEKTQKGRQIIQKIKQNRRKRLMKKLFETAILSTCDKLYRGALGIPPIIKCTTIYKKPKWGFYPFWF